MADTKSTPVMVRFAADQIEAIDAWRRLQDDLPTRPEAVRRLAEMGISAETQRILKKREKANG